MADVPVGWSATESGDDVDTDGDGLIGTWVFCHLPVTFHYSGRSLILRRSTPKRPLWPFGQAISLERKKR